VGPSISLPLTRSLRRACIDIGSNTTRLLVADCASGSLNAIVHEERAFTYLAWARLADGSIAPSKLKEVARVVAQQRQKAQQLGAREVRAVATAAIRRAPNGAELVEAVRATCAQEVEILTGEEEARLAFVGAAGTFDHVPAGELGVVDVGGGSSELVVGSVPDRVSWSASFPLGSGDLARRYLLSDPPQPAELAQARSEVQETLSRLDVPRPVEAAAVGGGAASLARLAGRVLDSAAFTRALAALAAAPGLQVARQFELEADRVRLLPAGLLILQAASERFGAPLVVAGGGLREGVLLEASDA
jgi:exopolyphosphatase / guanosine-5'-triphosphate,3'-diphosphate pyrophosphatase